MAIYNYSQVFWERIAQEERARLEEYRQAWDFYNGNQPLPLRTKFGQPSDNLILNLYGYIVDKGVAFLFGKELGMELKEGTDTASEDYLKEVWRVNKKMSLLRGAALNGGTCGHCFVEISPREGMPPRLINLDPAIVRPQWDPDDIEKRIWYKIEYEAINTDGKPILKKRLIELDPAQNNWVISRYEKRPEQPQYQQIDEVRWLYDFPPIVDWQNLPAPNVFFGKRDIEQVAPQNGINFVGSNMQRIIRYHGHPKTVGKGFTSGQGVTVGPDDMFILPGADADVKNLEMQSDLAATRAYFDTLIDLFFQLHHTPNMNPSKVSVGALSGFALKILYGDLLELTETKRLQYGEAIQELNRRLLVIGSKAEQETNLHWQSPLPENEQEETTVVTAQMDAGLMSKETARAKLELDNDAEIARLQAEALDANSVGSALLKAFNAGQVK